MEGFFEGMVELFDADLKRKGFDGITLPAGSYELHKINGVRLDINKSLDELGVQDGDTLVLVPRVAGESFEPQYESLSTGLAAMGKWLGRDGGDRMFAPVTPLTAAHTAVAIIAMAVGVVVALTLRARTFTDNPVPAAVSGAVGALLVVGAAVVWWGWRERRDLFSGFGWLAVVLLAVAGACAPPGTLGAAHGVIGLVIVILGAIAIGVMTRKRWQTAAVTAVVTVSGILAAVAVVRMFRPASAQVLAVCVLVGLLILVRMTPLIALWVARVRPPHFGSITGRDLFARREGMPVDTVSPVSEDESEDEDNELTDITARGAAIAASARLVNAVQVGVCVGVSIVLPAAVWGVLTPGRPWAWLALVVAGLVVGIFITQGRGFAAKYQAVALACGAAAAVCAGVVKYAIYEPKDVVSGLLWPAVAIAAFAACGLAAALLVPTVRFRPFIRLTVEWVEVLAFIVLLPAAAALGGLFTWIRH
ncbi:type VII secretion integral membrane protein EccD [Mycobacterium sp. 852002-53434_SCH5985345]|nr:type VII secretion integral membrane protein EccD [Mycobacterium sp. 852002-53434_SCH5985345]